MHQLVAYALTFSLCLLADGQAITCAATAADEQDCWEFSSEEAESMQVTFLQTSLHRAPHPQAQSVTPAEVSKAPAKAAAQSQVGRKSLLLLLQDALRQRSFVSTIFPSSAQNLTLLYVSLYLLTVATMLWCLHQQGYSVQKELAPGMKPRLIDVTDAEQQAWDQGFLRWLSISWASPWVAYWGSLPPRLPVRAQDLPQVGNADHQAISCARVFSKFWQEDFKASGGSPWVVRVVLKVWTVRSLVVLLLLVWSQTLITQVGSVLLLQEALRSLRHMRWRLDYEVEEDMAGPLVFWIVAFSALPLSSAILSSASSSLSCRLDQRLCGGLSVALFEKAQKLPRHQLRGAVDRSSQSHEGAASGMDLGKLVGHDVMSSLLGCHQNLCTLAGAGSALLVLLVMLWLQLGSAVLCVAALAVPLAVLASAMSAGLGRAMYRVQELTALRAGMLREVLQGIRAVKGCAWEEVVEERLAGLRCAEVEGLQRYYFFLGGLLGIFLSFPRLLLLAGFCAFSSLYGRQDPCAVFVCVQILAGLKSSLEAFARALGRARTVHPSLCRVEAFLRLPPVPCAALGDEHRWVDFWPAPRGYGPRGPLQEAGPSPPLELSLRLRGSFRWTELEDGPAALRDLDLELPPDALVAVVGAEGSGKTALLQALLGELAPVQENGGPLPALRRPESAAYCPQSPYIGEGTIRDNVIFGHREDEVRYAAALRAAGLETELHMLAGGDRMAVGVRGSALSASQRARVVLARAGYRRDARLVLLDEPFTGLDRRAAAEILEQLLLGPLMQDRPRVVALQPDPALLARFDHIIVLSGGRVKAQGPPQDVLQSAAFGQLADYVPTTEEPLPTREVVSTPAHVTSLSLSHRGSTHLPSTVRLQPGSAREDLPEGVPNCEMVRQYCRLGRWRNIVNASMLFCAQVILHVLCDLVLANWANLLSLHGPVEDKIFLRGYSLWLGLGVGTWLACWTFGEWFTLRISSQIHGLVLGRVLRAPLDRFFDRHPVGRIMKCLTADIAVVDLFLLMKSTGTMAVVFQTLIPLLYVHLVMPWFVLLLALPLYYYISAVASRYWNATIPLRGCLSAARATCSGLLADVTAHGAIIRAFQDQERVTAEMCEAVDGQLRACLLGERSLRRWLVNRVLCLWSFFASAVYIVSLLSPTSMGVGTLGLCLTSLLLLQSLIETNLDQVTGAQAEFVALARIQEYLSIPQEKPRILSADSKYQDFEARVSRKALRSLGELRYATYAYEGRGSAVEVFRDGTPILKSTPDGTALVAVIREPAASPKQPAVGTVTEARLIDLTPELALTEGWHRLVAVGSVARDAEAMARELCGSCHSSSPGGCEEQAEEDDTQEVLSLGIQSGWLVGGAHVAVENLKVGYGEAPRDALKGLCVSFGRGQKAAIVGPSGAGKSSLFLALLRLLEPRAGRILLAGVDTRQLGLATLRTVLGLVPQEPLVFGGSLRENLDPRGCLPDERLRQALASTGLLGLAESYSQGLDQRLSNHNRELSSDQRALLGLARLALRQPPLLLLDGQAGPGHYSSEVSLWQAAWSAFPTSTVLVATRSLEATSGFDKVVVLERGTVVDQGPPAEVLQRSSPAAVTVREMPHSEPS